MKWCRLLFRHVIIIGLFILAAGTSSAQETVRLANGEWPPFTSEKLKNYGVYSHIVTEAFALEGVTVEYRFFPWTRSYKNAVKGIWDGSVTWAPTPEKEREVFFSDPVVMHTKVFFHLKSFAFDWNSIDDLKGLNIAATTKYTYGQKFDQAARNGSIRVEYTTRDILNFKKVMARRVQLFPSDIDVGYNLLNANFALEKVRLITHHVKPVQETYTCVIFTRVNAEKSRHFLALFNRGLRKLKESGRYDSFLKASRRGEYRQE